MVHGPCGEKRPNASCMDGDKCTKYFPKKYAMTITIDQEGYLTYKRRNDGRTIILNNTHLDNRFVVPYNPTLLRLYQAHINVEKCNQSRAIKYLFKYISKGNERVAVGLFSSSNNKDSQCINDEVQQFLNCRYISSCEVSWRALRFPIHHHSPSVQRLSFHLPNKQPVVYRENQDITTLLDNPRVLESQFLLWMEMNKQDSSARKLTFSEFPTKYVFLKLDRKWKLRKRGSSVGRMPHISPLAGELYCLRLLLTQVRGPTSFDDIKTFNGTTYPTFKDACYARGLLDDDSEYIAAIKEAAVWASGNTLRRFFVHMLLAGSLKQPTIVWNETATILSEDMLYIPRADPSSSGKTINSHSFLFLV